MPKKPAEPPSTPTSIPPASKTRIRMEAYTDWLVVIATTGLVAMDKVPWEWGLGVIATIGGVTGILKGMGKSGGTLGVLIAAASKVGGKGLIGALPFLLACGSSAVQQIATEVALPVAREALTKLAEERGGTQVIAEAICYELDEQEDEDNPARVLDAVVCVVPRIPE